MGDVDDDPDTGLDQLLGRDAIDVGVIDDRDVVRGQPLDQVLRPAVQLGMAGQLDEAHWDSAAPSESLTRNRQTTAGSG